MWAVKNTILDDHFHKIRIFDDDKQLRYEDVIHLWRDDSEFREFYFSILQVSPFDAFFWEHPPVAASNIIQPYEFVLVDSPQLSNIPADPAPFQDRFRSAPIDQTVITFENLGRDAELVVACPIAAQGIYAHFASFIRNAPVNQKHGLFISLANSLARRITNTPTWVSTSGLGVYWLHIRLDTRPKYYTYNPYRQFSDR